MDLSALKDFKVNVWYRGFKLLTVVKIYDNTIVFSNADKISVDNVGRIHINGTIHCNMPDMNADNVLDMYKWHLKKKGYKFLD